MSKRGHRLKLRADEPRNEQYGSGPEREGVTHRPYDPNYRNCTFELATFEEQLARLYNEETIAHLAITRKPVSNGDGHLHQPVIRQANGTQLAVEALLRDTARQLIPLDEPLPAPFLMVPRLEPVNDPDSVDYVPPYKRGGWKVVEL